jgi:TonB family protein
MDDGLVYRKSGRGAAQLAATHHGALSTRERHLLILLDGRRTIAELCDLLGAESVRSLIPELEAKGFAKRVDPALAPEWANAITQFQVTRPAGETPGPAPNRRSDGHPLVWIALLTVAAVAGSHWATDRFKSQADAAWRFDLGQALPMDSYGVPTSSDAIDANPPQQAAPAAIAPISRLPAVDLVRTGAAAPTARTALRVATHDGPAIGRGEARGPSPVHRAPSTAASPPAGGSAPTPAVDVGAPVGLPGAAAVTSAAATASPAATPISAPDAVSAADRPAAAPGTEVAMAAPPAVVRGAELATEPPPTAARATEPAMAAPAAAASETDVAAAAPPPGEPVALRPLRHDPPRFPERALRDGIVQSQARVRLWVTPEGKVDQVDIIQATPPGLFDDEVRRALSLWTFEPPGRPMDEVVDLTLKP